MHTYGLHIQTQEDGRFFRELGFVVMRTGNSKICRALAEPRRLTCQVRADLWVLCLQILQTRDCKQRLLIRLLAAQT